MQATGSEDYENMDYIYTLYLFNTASLSCQSVIYMCVCVQVLVFLCICNCTHMTEGHARHLIWHSAMTSFKLGLEELVYCI